MLTFDPQSVKTSGALESVVKDIIQLPILSREEFDELQQTVDMAKSLFPYAYTGLQIIIEEMKPTYPDFPDVVRQGLPSTVPNQEMFNILSNTLANSQQDPWWINLSSKVRVRPSTWKKPGTVSKKVNTSQKEENLRDYIIVVQTKDGTELCSKDNNQMNDALIWKSLTNLNNGIVAECIARIEILAHAREASEAVQFFKHESANKDTVLKKFSEGIDKLYNFHKKCEWKDGKFIVTVEGEKIKLEDLETILPGVALYSPLIVSTNGRMTSVTVDNRKATEAIISQTETFLEGLGKIRKMGEDLSKQYPDSNFSGVQAKITEMFDLYEKNRRKAEGVSAQNNN
jgi:hypothetical protein